METAYFMIVLQPSLGCIAGKTIDVVFPYDYMCMI